MNLQKSFRHALRRAGFDISRFPEEHPANGVVKILNWRGVRAVVDIGAHEGGYAELLRTLGYMDSIHSFEPVSEMFDVAYRKSLKDSKWDVLRFALGDKRDEVAINVAGNRGASSSVLAMADRHREAAPESAYVRSEVVDQYTLDSIWGDVVGESEPAFVKLDVQGYENRVLGGASETLNAGLVQGLQIEVSLERLYDSGWSWDEALTWARENKFCIARIVPGFTDPRSGTMLQCDLVLLPATDGRQNSQLSASGFNGA